jgi:hypothetical protein
MCAAILSAQCAVESGVTTRLLSNRVVALAGDIFWDPPPNLAPEKC